MACDYDGFPLDDKLKDAAEKAAEVIECGKANTVNQDGEVRHMLCDSLNIQ